MKQCKHIVRKQPRRVSKRKSTLLISLLLLAAFAVGGTVAYLVTGTQEVKNTFTPAEVPPEIHEIVDDYKKEVTIQNTGNTSAYIRAAVIANAIDENGNVTGPKDVSSYLGGDNWTQRDGYWYYTKVVDTKGSTTDLVKDDIPLECIQVIVLAESIQAEGTDASGNKPVVLAWGFDPAA